MKTTNSSAGFSLLEVMCAILILGVGLVGLTQGITAALKSSKESELQTTASFIASGRIESLRSEGFLVDGEDEGDGGEGLSLYHWRSKVASTSIDGLHEVEIVVENANSRQTICELRTLLFEPPLDSTLGDSGTRPDGTKRRKEPRR